MKAVLIFGSNIGNREFLIQEAISKMKIIGELITCSSIYETIPWGFNSPDLFYNQIAIFNTNYTPQEILQHCLKTEQELGRKRTSTRYASRTMDIDILFCDSLVINTPDLIIPHPRLTLRNFVLSPLYEIIPEFQHPILHKSIAELYAACPDQLACTPVNKKGGTSNDTPNKSN